MHESIYSKKYSLFLRNLKKASLDVGFTQSEIASRFDRPQSFISKIENGERRLDIVETLYLAKLYKTSLEHLLGESDL